MGPATQVDPVRPMGVSVCGFTWGTCASGRGSHVCNRSVLDHSGGHSCAWCGASGLAIGSDAGVMETGETA